MNLPHVGIIFQQVWKLENMTNSIMHSAVHFLFIKK
jgi:hypothetical protein